MAGYRNTQQIGIAREDLEGAIQVDRGVPQTWGVPKNSPEQIASMTEALGVPTHAPTQIPKGSLQMVSVEWLIGQVDEDVMADKALEDNTSLRDHMEAGGEVPPIHVRVENPELIGLHDGHHRLAVAADLGWDEIACIVDGDIPAPPICTATTKKGNPCKAYAVTNSARCYGHNR